MLRYPTSEIKISAKDVDSAGEKQLKYTENKKQKQPPQQQQQQNQDQDVESSQGSSSSVSFTYDPPEYDDDAMTKPNSSSEYTNPSQGIKRPLAEPEPSQRKLSSQDHRARIARQRLGIDQQTQRKK